jgi:2-polyprenyl-3-methyl-5-hydroxy-6-metoxy-1,4-benzoquinol methylase
MSDTSEITPVVLFVFNRHKQLKRTLECLRTNSIPLLIVYADGPRNADDLSGIKEVRRLIKDIDWVPVEKHFAKNNKGLSNSIQQGLSHVFHEYEQAVIIEDDVCVAPNFYSFMVECLQKYKKDYQIAGVTGLRYPFYRSALDQIPEDVFLTPRFSSWGWGTWKRQWKTLNFKPEDLLNQIDLRSIDQSTGGEDLPYAIEEIRANRLTGCWDVYFYMNMLIQNRFFVWPKYNMVLNSGLTEGTHAHGEAPAWELKWEPLPSSQVKFNIPTKLLISSVILTDFLKFFKPENLEVRKTGTKLASSVSYNKSRLRDNLMIKKSVNKALGSVGYQIIKKPDVITPAVTETIPPKEDTTSVIDPADYSTTDEPMEVPCQKVAYYYALNNLIKQGDRVLDVGSGLGYGMAILSVKANEVNGIDVDMKAVRHAKNEYVGNNPKIKNVQKYDGYKTPFADNSFDVITCIDVLEHVEDYDRFLDELLRISKKYVLISTPNQRPEYTHPDGKPKNIWHLREWKPTELDSILKKHKASVEWHYINGPFEGPFKLRKIPSKDTLVLMPILKKY